MPDLVEEELQALVDKGILKVWEDGRYEFRNRRLSGGIDGVYRVFLPTSTFFSTLTRSGIKDVVSEVLVNAEQTAEARPESKTGNRAVLDARSLPKSLHTPWVQKTILALIALGTLLYVLTTEPFVILITLTAGLLTLAMERLIDISNVVPVPDDPSGESNDPLGKDEIIKMNLINKVLRPKKYRSLTSDEMLTIQGFPASFQLHESHSKNVALIGNSVPPPLVEALACVLFGCIELTETV